jgi:hypothetical protein
VRPFITNLSEAQRLRVVNLHGRGEPRPPLLCPPNRRLEISLFFRLGQYFVYGQLVLFALTRTAASSALVGAES